MRRFILSIVLLALILVFFPLLLDWLVGVPT